MSGFQYILTVEHESSVDEDFATALNDFVADYGFTVGWTLLKPGSADTLISR